LVRDAIREVAPVAVKKAPQAKIPKLKPANRPPRPSRFQGGSPRKAKIAAPISPAKMLAVSSRMSVPVPAGQGWEISYGVFPEAQVPGLQQRDELYVEEDDSADEQPQAERRFDQIPHLPAARLIPGSDDLPAVSQSIRMRALRS
jgi:hypothetical protein